MNETIKLMGTLTTLSPMIHIDESSGNTTYCMKTSIPFRNESGDLEIRQIPYVQGSSFRGSMRNAMADILSQVVNKNGEGLNLNTAMRLFSGGRMEANKSHSLKEAREILQRCIDLNLFGGIDGGMFTSNVMFDMLYPITETTLAAKIVPNHYSKFECEESTMVNDKFKNLLQEFIIQTRRDEVIDTNKEIMSSLSSDGYQKAEDYLLEGIKTQGKKAEERKDKSLKNDEKTKKTIQKHFAKIEAIPAGINLFSSITVSKVDKVTMGLFLVTLKEFLKTPYLASASRSGYGKVAAKYDLKVGDEIINDFITLDQFGDPVMALDKYGQDCVDAFNEWSETATSDTLKVQ